jgi:hypothetical protein
LKHEQILKQQEAMLKTQQQRILKQKQEEIDLIRNYQTRIAKSVILKLLKKKLLTAWRTWKVFIYGHRNLAQSIQNKKLRKKRRASQVVKRLYNSQLQKAFHTWIIRVSELKQYELRMEAIKLEKLKHDRVVVKRTIDRLSRRHLYSAFLTWVKHTNTLSIMYTMLGREKERNGLRKCFTYWLKFHKEHLRDKANVKKTLKRLQNKLLFSGFNRWKTQIIKGKNVQQNTKLRRQSEVYLQDYQTLKLENSKLKRDIQARDNVLKQMEAGLISAQNNIRLTRSIKEALEEESTEKKNLEIKLEQCLQENEDLRQTNSEIKLRMEKILTKKRELQSELSIRSDRNVTYKYRYETLKDENEDLQDSLDKSQAMYREVKEKLLRSLTLLEDLKGQQNDKKIVKVLKTDVENKTLVLNEQGEQIIMLRQRLAKMRNTIKDLREDRILAKKMAENERLKAEAAINAAVASAVSKADWRIQSSPLKRTYTTPSSLRRNSVNRNLGSSSSNRKKKTNFDKRAMRFDLGSAY